MKDFSRYVVDNRAWLNSGYEKYINQLNSAYADQEIYESYTIRKPQDEDDAYSLDVWAHGADEKVLSDIESNTLGEDTDDITEFHWIANESYDFDTPEIRDLVPEIKEHDRLVYLIYDVPEDMQRYASRVLDSYYADEYDLTVWIEEVNKNIDSLRNVADSLYPKIEAVVNGDVKVYASFQTDRTTADSHDVKELVESAIESVYDTVQAINEDSPYSVRAHIKSIVRTLKEFSDIIEEEHGLDEIKVDTNRAIDNLNDIAGETSKSTVLDVSISNKSNAVIALSQYGDLMRSGLHKYAMRSSSEFGGVPDYAYSIGQEVYIGKGNTKGKVIAMRSDHKGRKYYTVRMNNKYATEKEYTKSNLRKAK